MPCRRNESPSRPCRMVSAIDPGSTSLFGSVGRGIGGGKRSRKILLRAAQARRKALTDLGATCAPAGPGAPRGMRRSPSGAHPGRHPCSPAAAGQCPSTGRTPRASGPSRKQRTRTASPRLAGRGPLCRHGGGGCSSLGPRSQRPGREPGVQLASEFFPDQVEKCGALVQVHRRELGTHRAFAHEKGWKQ